MDTPLRRLDRIMWDAEAPNSLTTIAGIMTFKKKLSAGKLLSILDSRMLRFERFRKKVVIRKGAPHWHSDDDFDLHAHIHHIALPGRGSYKDLQTCVSELISTPFDYDKPLWSVHVIDNYRSGTALLWRLHHAMADGMSLVKVIYSLTGSSARDSLSVPDLEPEPKPASIADDVIHLIRAGQNAYEEARQMLRDPSLLRDTLVNQWETVKEMGELLASDVVAKSIYKGTLGTSKKAAWTDPLALEKIKRIAKFYEATINDIVVAVVAGAVRKHLLRHHQKATEGLKVIQPVNMRNASDINEMHNDFTWMSFDLPVHLRSCRQRIAFVKERTAKLKPRSEPVVLNELVHLMADYTPQQARQKFLDFIGTHIAGAITNIPGPRQPIYLAGQKVEDIVFWIPHTTHLGIGISVVSYDGRVYMGLVADQGLVDDPDVITSFFADELQQMEKGLKQKTTSKPKSPLTKKDKK